MALDPYIVIIILSSILIISYMYGIISKRTNIPSVVLLIATGMAITIGLDYFEMPLGETNWLPILKILGNVGLVMIVLEASLDLKLSKEKWPIIWKALAVAFFGLMVTTIGYTFFIEYLFGVGFNKAYLYSIPLSVISSAIVIPSVVNSSEHTREFLIYESTFSDIFGIMLFYFELQILDAPAGKSVGLDIFLNITTTLIIAIVLSYLLTIVFQKITSSTKLFLLIAVLMLLYSVGKLMHISSLLIILFFGLLLNNHKLFFIRGLEKHVDDRKVRQTLMYFQVITLETSFVVRTFFFLTFGISITVASLFNLEILLLGLIFVGVMIVLRYVLFVLFAREFTIPALFVAPRGLITILLFFSIPEAYVIPQFENGILLYIILITSGIMTLALMTKDREEKLPGILKATSRMLKADERSSTSTKEEE